MVQILHRHETRGRTDDRLGEETLYRVAEITGKTILLVEPDPDRQWKLTRNLAKIGRRVVATASSAGAIAFLNQYLASLVLVAEDLPRTQGSYLAATLKKHHPGLPVFILRGGVTGDFDLNSRCAEKIGPLKGPSSHTEPRLDRLAAVNSTAA
jgi:PleD family two-component response regulator